MLYIAMIHINIEFLEKSDVALQSILSMNQ